MLSQKMVMLLHYPPYTALQQSDYLNNATLNRWQRILTSAGVAASDTTLYTTTVDIFPIAAPGSGETGCFPTANAMNFFGLARLTEEMSRTQSAMRDAAGVAPVYFRPPMGLSNPRVFKAASSLGLKVVGWTARGIDTQIRDSNRVVQRILRGVRPGAIILLHDGNIPPERLLPTVKLLLAKLRGQGYQFARLDHLLK